MSIRARSLWSARLLHLVRPRVGMALWHGIASRRGREDAVHLEAAIAWLERAQDVTGTGGVAARYDLATGWDRAYPETTGYIIPTLLHSSQVLDSPGHRERAIRMGEWLTTVQQPNGAIPAGLATDDARVGRPEVFNTGQVLLGWLALAEVTGDEQFPRSAHRAATWLAQTQDDDGAWRRATLHQAEHSYYTRVAWAMARAGSVLDEPAFSQTARRAVERTLQLQHENGWIDRMSFSEGTDPLTHTIAYTIEGLLECALVLDAEPAWDAAGSALRALDAARRRETRHPRRSRDLAATFTSDWRPSSRYSCVTGTAQIALCCRRIDAFEPDAELRASADELIESAKRCQSLTGPDGVKGGIPGSWPIYGGYGSMRYLNWAAKFFVDVLLDRVAGLPRVRGG